MTRRRLALSSLLAPLILLCAGAAVAAEGLSIGDGQCPEKQAASGSDVAVPVEAATQPKTTQVRGGGGGDADKPTRNKPRWQSYLPGMIR
jgi:hypothetical protein